MVFQHNLLRNTCLSSIRARCCNESIQAPRPSLGSTDLTGVSEPIHRCANLEEWWYSRGRVVDRAPLGGIAGCSEMTMVPNLLVTSIRSKLAM